ncbi:MAG: 3-hydroxyacyl-CoA dehydrogenase/enoyl-CoA hydratase family protein [Proteobacteria bacterium]|nr:3-hydroxyacyl-CoA dehydrogenase/enoyl-CoA hydratase family protein [Pseudomonadota bacterium]
MFKIRRAVVLGSGVMGAQIAALLAAAGVRVHLLDLAANEPPKDPKEAKLVGKNFRSYRAALAIEGLKSIKPSPLFSQSFLANIIPGNFDDDLQVVRDCDWVVEAVVEKLEVKQQLFKRVLEYAKCGIPITTNTSGINLKDIANDMPEHFQECFFGTHFFNPPRYMKLLEVIPHGATNRDLVTKFCAWSEQTLGKGIVDAYDTVNFVANRIGVFVNQSTLQAMTEFKLNIETVDSLTGKLMGRPSSATFRTMDVVGLDTFAHVAKNTYDRAPNDPYREWFKMPEWIDQLIKKGHLGQKSNSVGCYKKDKDAKGKTVILALRSESGAYEEQKPAEIPWLQEISREQDLLKRMQFAINQNDAAGQFVWKILKDTFSYCALLVEDIAGGMPKTIDDGIKWGFNWDMGPFELWQGLGFDSVLTRLQKENVKLPQWVKPGLKFYDHIPGSIDWMTSGATDQLQLGTDKRRKIPQASHLYRLPRFQNEKDSRTVMSVKNASLVDIGHGVACLTFHSKMNALDSSIVEFMMKAIAKTSEGFHGLVIGNEGDAFSAGANLKEVLDVINKKDWTQLNRFIRTFQGAMQLLKFAPFPSVAATHGLVLGGGCEVALHCSHRIVSGETYAGLVEIGVGLLPAGGGTKELALRCYDAMSVTERGDPMAFLQRAFLLIGMARTSSSGHEAIEMGLFPGATSTISLSRDHIIERAKAQVLHMTACGYAPPTPRSEIKVLGDPGLQTFKMMLYNMKEQKQVSAHDALIAERVAKVLCGGEIDGGLAVSEQYLLDLEREAFVELCQTEKTQARIEGMLKTGSPVRN